MIETKETRTMKATHNGTCQICGSFQKLPKGKLSLHGYTVRWGFFSGVCTGSKALPFEQSKDLIEGAIARAKNMLAETRKESADLKSGALKLEGNKAYVHAYFSPNSRRDRGGYKWTVVNVTLEKVTYDPADGGTGFYYKASYKTDDQARPHDISIPYDMPRIEDEAAMLASVQLMLNAGYAKSELDSRASQLAQYITWQEERIADWKPTDLKPIAE
jgi:hypothetical protein